MASDIRKRASLVDEARGLSPFFMVNFTEEYVALLQEDHEDMFIMSQISTLEVKATRTKQIESIPTDSEGFIMMLKIFANLLFAVFSSSCSLQNQVYAIIKLLSVRIQDSLQNKSSG